jgi:hypothetical protein
MTPKEILAIDAQRNQPPGTTVGDLIAIINDELRAGGNIVQEGDVLIMFRSIEPGVVEYHPFNADTPQNLYKAVTALWRMLKKAGTHTARTTYENKNINRLFAKGRPEFDIQISEKDGLFTADARL